MYSCTARKELLRILNFNFVVKWQTLRVVPQISNWSLTMSLPTGDQSTYIIILSCLDICWASNSVLLCLTVVSYTQSPCYWPNLNQDSTCVLLSQINKAFCTQMSPERHQSYEHTNGPGLTMAGNHGDLICLPRSMWGAAEHKQNNAKFHIVYMLYRPIMGLSFIIN